MFEILYKHNYSFHGYKINKVLTIQKGEADEEEEEEEFTRIYYQLYT